MKKFWLYILPLIYALQSCGDIEDKYMYGEGLYTIDWNAAADSCAESIIKRFWNEQEGYFNYNSDQTDGPNEAWSYWPQAHAMDVLVDAYLRTNDASYRPYFDKWYEGVKKKSGNSYFNNFYDDMEWIALTMIRLYEATDDAKFLDTAKLLWNDIKNAWNDEYANGGLAWTKDKPWSKNACSNGPGGLVAIRIYLHTQDETDKEWAMKIYQWERENLFNPANGAVYDNIDGRSGERSNVTLSYNQGTFLGLAHELYKATGNAVYLKDAQKAANYGCSNSGMIDTGNNILRDEGTGDGGLFKGIYMRYYVKLLQDPDLNSNYRKKFITFFNNNADVLWRKGVNKSDLLFSNNWTKAAEGSTQLTSHTSGCTLIEAKAYFENNK